MNVKTNSGMRAAAKQRDKEMKEKDGENEEREGEREKQ